MHKVLECEKLNGCPAMALAVEGWADILRSGNGSDCVVLSWDQSVLWIEDEGVPVALIVWQYQEYRREIWIAESYTTPEFRGRGLFRQLYLRLVEVARAKKAVRVAGGVHVGNSAMRAAAYACGRQADYVVYSQAIVEGQIA